MQYFLFITVDASHFELRKKLPAVEVINNRLNLRLWPIYQRTNHKDHISSGDKCLFYVGGTKELIRHVIASATILDVSVDNSLIDHEDYSVSLPYKKLILDTPNYFSAPVNLKDFLSNLSFVPKNTKYWGTSLQGGCKKITSNDYELLNNSEIR
ncbi:hypothetical protein CXF85_08680 [Colwellia sp. 75C3]|uniref:hypothetical protein n=1 Tax=Colwellia sp. 75C3 TaxID=888425 RepID=UPI000C34D958|nr:hypothetical protein [Colwellia sp. 75C3]PKG84386.1 hypothetical protein CXF85_08680 [Colwellia sp. 75C3]